MIEHKLNAQELFDMQESIQWIEWRGESWKILSVERDCDDEGNDVMDRFVVNLASLNDDDENVREHHGLATWDYWDSLGYGADDQITCYEETPEEQEVL